jgi:hypothetical protein
MVKKKEIQATYATVSIGTTLIHLFSKRIKKLAVQVSNESTK